MQSMLIHAGEVAADSGLTGLHAAMFDMAVLVSNCKGVHVQAVLECMTAFLSLSCILFWEGDPIPKPAALGICVAFLALQTSLSSANMNSLVQGVFAAAFDPLPRQAFALFCAELPPYFQLYFTAQQIKEDTLDGKHRM